MLAREIRTRLFDDISGDIESALIIQRAGQALWHVGFDEGGGIVEACHTGTDAESLGSPQGRHEFGRANGAASGAVLAVASRAMFAIQRRTPFGAGGSGWFKTQETTPRDTLTGGHFA